MSIGLLIQCAGASNLESASAPKPLHAQLSPSFSPQQYETLLERIRQLDRDIYHELKQYEETFGQPAFKKADLIEPTVLRPSQASHGIPLMIIPATTSDEELSQYLGSYRALHGIFVPDKNDLPEADYQIAMNILKEIAPDIYQDFKNDELFWGKRRIMKSSSSEGYAAFHPERHDIPYSLQHLRLFIPLISTLSRAEQTAYLGQALTDYRNSVSEEDDERPFPMDEYHEYMALMQIIDPEVHTQLVKTEKAHWANQAFELPHDENDADLPYVHFIGDLEELTPVIVINPLTGKTREEKIEVLQSLLPILKEGLVEERESALSHKKNQLERKRGTELPKEFYDHYLSLAKDINEAFYHNLIVCEQALGMPCLREVTKGDIRETTPTEETQGFPLLLIPDRCRHLRPEIMRNNLALFTSYKRVLPITQEERDRTLRALERVAKELYDELVAVDPLGINHIQRDYKDDDNALVTAASDGLPLIKLGEKTAQEDDFLFFWTIAHEVGHYFHGHIHNSPPVRHKIMREQKQQPNSSKLPFEETFANRACQQCEYEADAFAITYGGIPIEVATFALESMQPQKIAPSPRYTFTTTHPQRDRAPLGNTKQLNDDIASFGRIAHTRGLEREVERLKIQGNYPRRINWKQVIQEYRNKLGLGAPTPQEKLHTTSKGLQ